MTVLLKVRFGHSSLGKTFLFISRVILVLLKHSFSDPSRLNFWVSFNGTKYSIVSFPCVDYHEGGFQSEKNIWQIRQIYGQIVRKKESFVMFMNNVK